MLNLNVLMWVRPDFHTFPGGDTIQVKYTVRALSEIGCQVDISCDPNFNIDEYDIIHLWHLERCQDTWLFYRQAKKKNKRIFLTPIYWPVNHQPFSGFFKIHGRALEENVKYLIRLCMLPPASDSRRFIFASLKNGWLHCREQLLNGVDQLIPNSDSESQILRQELLHEVPITVVPNVIDLHKCDATEKLPWDQRTMILCAGHFCPRKNQLALINALNNTGISVVFAGGSRPMHRRYYEHCLKAACGRHTFLGNCSNQRVLELMGQSKVHVQTSILETPGIVNLEAGLMGCNLVLPPVDPVRDYFGDLGHYFSTYKSPSIRKTIISAITKNPAQSIENHIRKNYTMVQLKSQLLIAYQHE